MLTAAIQDRHDVKRCGFAAWGGTSIHGSGTISTGSGLLKDAPYSLLTPTPPVPETNPEELLGAAQAGCFTLSLAVVLDRAGFTEKQLHTEADITLIKTANGLAVDAICLVIEANVPGLDEAQFEAMLQHAKAICPISKTLNATILFDTRLNKQASRSYRPELQDKHSGERNDN